MKGVSFSGRAHMLLHLGILRSRPNLGFLRGRSLGWGCSPGLLRLELRLAGGEGLRPSAFSYAQEKSLVRPLEPFSSPETI